MGTNEERLAVFRQIFDTINERIGLFLEQEHMACLSLDTSTSARVMTHLVIIGGSDAGKGTKHDLQQASGTVAWI